MSHNCRSCRHLEKDYESWELPNIWWWECAARPQYANLRSFPFKATDCPDYDVKVIKK